MAGRFVCVRFSLCDFRTSVWFPFMIAIKKISRKHQIADMLDFLKVGCDEYDIFLFLCLTRIRRVTVASYAFTIIFIISCKIIII